MFKSVYLELLNLKDNLSWTSEYARHKNITKISFNKELIDILMKMKKVGVICEKLEHLK